jgi:hypothetical protein
MTDTVAQRFDAPTELPRSQHAFTPESLPRLPRPGCAQKIVVTSPDTLSAAFIIDAVQTAAKSEPAIDRVGRLEVLNDATDRKLKVFRKSPRPPRARNLSDNYASDRTSAAECSDNAADRVRDVVETDPPIDRVGRLEVLNDVTGRELRVFRKSPCPPRARNSAPASYDDTSGGAYTGECFKNLVAREVKASPCLHLRRRYSLMHDAVA